MPFPLTVTDARGATVSLRTPPRRIVSLVPSQTELLAHLGLDEEVVGCTRFCVRPAGWKAARQIVGGTKNVRVDRVRALRPDLVLANHEENTRAVVEALDAVVPVYVTSVGNVPEACAMIRTVGRLTGRDGRAAALAQAVEARFAALPRFAPLRTAYLIWRDPYMSVGRDTFIHDVLRRGGLQNVCASETRYPVVTPEALAEAAPEVVLLSSEPFPFRDKHTEELRAALPGAAVCLVDGQPFSWYGPRLLETPAYLKTLRAALGERRDVS